VSSPTPMRTFARASTRSPALRFCTCSRSVGWAPSCSVRATQFVGNSA